MTKSNFENKEFILVYVSRGRVLNGGRGVATRDQSRKLRYHTSTTQRGVERDLEVQQAKNSQNPPQVTLPSARMSLTNVP